MSLAKRIRTSEGRTQSSLSCRSGDSSSSLAQTLTEEGYTVFRTPRQPWRALVIVSLICLMLMLLPIGVGAAFAQTGNSEESFVEGVVANVNAYWEKQFQLLGQPYSPAKLVFVHDRSLDTPCGPALTEQGPAYCPDDGTLYYPLDWLLDGRTLAQYGDAAVEWAIAHEIAHNAQVQMANLGVPGVDVIPGVQTELQADCLAGTYVDQAITQPGDIEAALAAIGESGSPGHGSSQQRIAAFELGYNTGDPAQCLAIGDGGTTTGGSDSPVG